MLTTYVVDTLDDVVATDGFVSLREAIQAANFDVAITGDVAAGQSDGDQILFDPSLANQTIELTGGELVVRDDLVIDGSAASVIISGQKLSRVFFIDAGSPAGSNGHVLLKNLQISDGRELGIPTGNGSAVATGVGSRVTLDTVIVAENEGVAVTEGGGGLLTILRSTIRDNAGTGVSGFNASVIHIFDSTIQDNHTSSDGGGVVNNGVMVITNSKVTGNTADMQGGGLFVNSMEPNSTTLTNVTISGNSAASGGGGIHADQGSVRVIGGQLDWNTGNLGGGVYLSALAPLTMQGTVVSKNVVVGSVPSGGGIYLDGNATAVLTNVTIEENEASNATPGGGGIFAGTESSLSVYHSSISFNSTSGTSGGDGGGVYSLGTTLFEDSKIHGNTAIDDGGGFYSGSGSHVFRRSFVTHNLAESLSTNDGGGIDIQNGNLLIEESEVSHNTSDRIAGVLSSGTTVITRSLIANNVATQGNFAGGVYHFDVGSGGLQIINSTISGNSTGGNGGGVEVQGGTAEIRNSTIAFNVADSDDSGQKGGGLYVHSTAMSVVVHNTIIAQNTRGSGGAVDDVSAPATKLSGTHNLIGSGDGQSDLTNGVDGNLIGTAGSPLGPQLSVLSDNGGRLRTHRLLSGSPARNAGDVAEALDDMGAPLEVDMTGRLRVSAGQVDIGAFEVQIDGVYVRDQTTGRFYIGNSTGAAFNQETGALWSPSVSWQFLEGDFNGDGLTDVVGRLPSGQWWVGLGGTGLTPRHWHTWNPLGNVQFVDVGDFNGDGLDDIVAQQSGDGGLFVLRSNGSRFIRRRFGTFSPTAYKNIQAGDMNGDGLSDVIGQTNNGVWFAGISTGTSFTLDPFGSFTSTANWQNHQVGDFSGDGVDDVLVQNMNDGRWYYGTSTGSAFSVAAGPNWNPAAGFMDHQLGDFNGDGRTDLAARLPSGQFFVLRSTGNSSLSEFWGSWSGTASWISTAGDFNADGRDDIAGLITTSATWYVQLSTGTAFNISFFGDWTQPTNPGFLTSGLTDDFFPI